MIYCSKCGKEIPDESKFCTFCGAAVPAIVTQKSGPLRTGPYRLSDHRGDFIRSAGFWGSLFVLLGFFLPWLQNITSHTSLSGLNLITVPKVGRLVLLIFPVCALFILIDSMTNFLPSVAAGFFKCLPLLLLVVLTFLLITGHKQKGTNDWGINMSDLQSVLKFIGIGLWSTLTGSVILLFHKKYKRV